MEKYDWNEITRILENVIDSYDDFVTGLRSDLRYHPENIAPVLKYIHDNPTRTTSEITEYELFLEGKTTGNNRLQNATLSL